MKRSMWAALVAAVAGLPLGAQPPAAAPAPKVELALEDQFERKTDLADLRGSVVVLVFGDRKGNDACRVLGEQLHVRWHPDAKGQPPAKARAAAVAPLDGLRPGVASPDVIVVPVACCGKVPTAVRPAIRKGVVKSAPDTVVWLDFADKMKDTFGVTAGETNIAVVDAAGRLRLKINGTLDLDAMDKLVQTIQSVRYDAVK